MFVGLGKTLLSYSDVIPGGIVLFFSSYACMRECINFWLLHRVEGEDLIYGNLYELINNIKPIFIEPKNATDVVGIFNDYAKTVKIKNNALMMAVCRARLSEGIDFADELARSVILVSVPNLNKRDIEIQIKIEYVNKMKLGDWFNNQTIRAMNQAAGRIIRHSKDYGALILIDERFSTTHPLVGNLS